MEQNEEATKNRAPYNLFTDQNKTVTLGFLNERKYRNMHQEVLSKEMEIKEPYKIPLPGKKPEFIY
jgi:hypothetical protein